MTLRELIAKAQKERAAKLAERNAAAQTLVDLLGIEPDKRAEDHDAKVTEARAAKVKLDTEINTVEARVADYEAEAASDEASDAKARETTVPTQDRGKAYDEVARTGAEERTYSSHKDRQGAASFFCDAFSFSYRADVQARERLERHGKEALALDKLTERATTTTSFAGLIVPQYLVDQAALLARAGRPVANTCLGLPLPDQGMSFIIPRGTTGAATAIQATENTSVQNTDQVWANVTVPVVTIAGQQDVSRQSLERGTPGIDQLIYLDLAGAYAANLDSQVISGSGSGGQMLGIYNTAGVNQATAFGAAATPATFYSKTGGQLSTIETTRYLPPTVIAMHPRRWNWLLTQVDSSNRPLVVPNQNGPYNAVGVQDGLPDYGRVVGTLFGLPVVTDANIQTAQGTGPEDVVYVYRAEDLLLWEDGDGMPRQLRFEQTLGNQLTVKLVAYNYVAFTAGRYPAAVGLVGGNAGSAGFGLAAPVF